MSKFEYRIEGFSLNNMPNDAINAALTKFGSDGWEVIAVGWPSHAYVLLKRFEGAPDVTGHG